MHPFIETMRQKANANPPISSLSVDAARQYVASGREFLGNGPEVLNVGDLAIPSPAGKIACRLILPSAKPRGIVIYMHGGGWVLGEIGQFEPLCRTLAVDLDYAVFLPGYRLAPEAPFPAGLEDTITVLRWVSAHHREILGGELPIVVAGDSAGANLATVAALHLHPAIPIAAQMLIYPVTDCRFDTHSYREFGEGMILARADMEWFFRLYAPQKLWTSPDISPLRADLSNAPPTCIVTAGWDVLRDEGNSFARKLEGAGVAVSAREVPCVTHGFIRFHEKFDVARECLRWVARETHDLCVSHK